MNDFRALMIGLWQSACQDTPKRPSARVEDGHFVLTVNGNRGNWAAIVQAAGVPAEAPQTIDGLAMTDPTYTIAATTGDHMIGPLSDKLVQTNGQVYLDWSAATNTSVAVITVP